MKPATQQLFITAQRTEALKVVSDYISDHHKDLEPLKTRRLRTAALIGTSSVAIATLVIPGETLPALLIKALTLLAGLVTLDIVDTKMAQEIQEKKNCLNAARKLQSHFLQAQTSTVALPADLDAFIAYMAARAAHKQWPTKNDPTKRMIRAGIVATGIVAFGYAGFKGATEGELGKLYRKIENVVLPLRSHSPGLRR